MKHLSNVSKFRHGQLLHDILRKRYRKSSKTFYSSNLMIKRFIPKLNQYTTIEYEKYKKRNT